MENRIFVVQELPDLERCYPLIKELRKDLSYSDYLSIYQESHQQNGYELVAIECQDRVLGVMGYRLLSNFRMKKYLQIDDLIICSSLGNRGLGSKLLRYAEYCASEAEIRNIVLNTSYPEEVNSEFFFKNGWLMNGGTYLKRVGIQHESYLKALNR